MTTTTITEQYKRHYELIDGVITNASEDPAELSNCTEEQGLFEYTLVVDGDQLKYRTKTFYNPQTGKHVFVDYLLKYYLGDGYTDELKKKELDCFDKHCSCCADELFSKDACTHHDEVETNDHH